MLCGLTVVNVNCLEVTVCSFPLCLAALCFVFLPTLLPRVELGEAVADDGDGQPDHLIMAMEGMVTRKLMVMMLMTGVMLMTGMDLVITRTPKMAQKQPRILPKPVTGLTSP